jgi:hypothetical protein
MWAEHPSAGPPSSIRGDTPSRIGASFSAEQERPLLAQGFRSAFDRFLAKTARSWDRPRRGAQGRFRLSDRPRGGYRAASALQRGYTHS